MYLFQLADGWCGVSITARGIYALTLPAPSREEAVAGLERASGEVDDDDLRQRVVCDLTAYFEGGPVTFHLPVDLSGYSHFQRSVLEELAAIPWGTTRTYGEVAQAVGRPRAARAVGQACGQNRIPVVIPCHRVTAAGGLGGFGAGLAWKRRLLALEGMNGRSRLPGAWAR